MRKTITLLTIVVAMLLILNCSLISAFALEYGSVIESGKCEGSSIEWTVYDTNGDLSADTLVLKGTGIMPDYHMSWISGVLDENDTSIPWIKHSKAIETIIVDGSISHIGDCAFAYMPIKTIDLASFCTSNLTIGRFSFYNCSNLEIKELPNNVVSIGDAAFENCSIKQITLPNSIVHFGNYCIRFDNDVITDDLTIHNQFEIRCEKNSDAYKYGVSNNLSVTIIESSGEPSSAEAELRSDLEKAMEEKKTAEDALAKEQESSAQKDKIIAELEVMATQIKSVKAKPSKNKASVSWKSAGSGFKYQVYISTKPDSGFAKKATSEKASVTIKKLASKKTYYVRL